MLITRLAFNSLQSASPIFPDKRNAGPYMPDSVWIERAKADGVFDRILIDECSDQLPAPSPRRELRLLCLLVENVTDSYTVPLATMHPVPPRTSFKGKWPSIGSSCVFMRETHAIAPAPEVLARLQRHGQTRSLCAAESPRRHCATV